jgi:hypothetical protein
MWGLSSAIKDSSQNERIIDEHLSCVHKDGTSPGPTISRVCETQHARMARLYVTPLFSLVLVEIRVLSHRIHLSTSTALSMQDYCTVH